MPTSNASLTADLSSMKTILTRIDTSVEKLTDISRDVTTLLAVHENRIAFQEKITADLKDLADKRRDETIENFNDLHQTINDVKDGIHDKMDEQKKDIMAEMDKNKKDADVDRTELKKRMSHLERWLWLFSGGGAVVMFLLEKFPNILHLGP